MLINKRCISVTKSPWTELLAAGVHVSVHRVNVVLGLRSESIDNFNF